MTVMVIMIIIMRDRITRARRSLDQRLQKDPHPCRKRRHTGDKIGFERRSRRRIFEKLASLLLDLIALPFTDQEIAQPVKRLDRRASPVARPKQLAGRGRTKVMVTLPSLIARRRASVCTTILAGTASVRPRSFAAVMPSTSIGLVAPPDGVDDRARIGRVGFLGELVEPGLIVEPAIDPPEGFGLRQPLQRLVDGVPRSEIDEITVGVQTLRGASARMRRAWLSSDRQVARSCPKIVGHFSDNRQ